MKTLLLISLFSLSLWAQEPKKAPKFESFGKPEKTTPPKFESLPPLKPDTLKPKKTYKLRPAPLAR